MLHKGTYQLIGSLLLVFCLVVSGKTQITVQTNLDADQQVLWQLDETYADSTLLYEQVEERVVTLREKGYLLASLDSLTIRNDTAFLQLFTGKKYYWSEVDTRLIPEALRQKRSLGFDEKNDRVISLSNLEKSREFLLRKAMENGYPFAAVFLDSIEVDSHRINARLVVEPGRFIVFGQVNPLGDIKMSSYVLQRYLDIIPGEPYDHAKVQKIDRRLRELPYLVPLRREKIRFINEKAHVDLFLEKKPSNRFDFLLGILPNSGIDGKTRLTGNVLADLNNQFGQGERLYISFDQLKEETQQLDMNVRFPFLPGLPFGFDGNFLVYKRDTSWLDVKAELGVLYLLGGTNSVKAFWKTDRSTLLTIDEDRIIQSKSLPEDGDIRVNSFGAEWFYQDLDYIFNPRKGWQWTVRVSAGFKKFRKNTDILSLKDPENPSFDFETLYEDRALEGNDYRMQLDLSRFWPLGPQSTLLTRIRGRSIVSDNDLYRNEQMRIGGNKRMRGFDEESIFASTYGVGTMEYRILTGRNGFLVLFQDVGYVIDNTVATDSKQWLWGFGAGLSFETNIGIFSLNYALGKREGQPVDMRNGKVHFGYLSLF